jgi:hypothetical protein
VCGCNIGRIRGEERVLGQNLDYEHYVHQVRWRLLPGVW